MMKDIESKIIDKWKEKYNSSVFLTKMDTDNILYCEGNYKPLFRGYLHYVAIAILVVQFYPLYNLCKTIKQKLIISSWILINIFTFTISIIFHTYDLNPIQEINIQKIDHLMIYINTLNHIIQYLFLYNFDKESITIYYSYFILFVSLSIVILGIYLIFSCKKKYYHIIFLLIPVILLIPLVINIFKPIQSIYFFIIWVVMLLGLIIYNIQKPISNIFGYHEYFHIFTIVSLIFSILLEKSLLVE